MIPLAEPLLVGLYLTEETLRGRVFVVKQTFAELRTVPKHFLCIRLYRRRPKMAALLLFFSPGEPQQLPQRS